MSLVVKALHVAWVGYVPARGRSVRNDVVRCTVEASVPEAARSAFERADPFLDGPLEAATLLGEGGLWRPVFDPAFGTGPVTPGHLARVLAGDGYGPHSRAGIRLLRTPLLAAPDLGRREPFEPARVLTDGAEVNLDAVRAIHEDGRPAAAAAARAFLASEFRIVGDTVLRRVRDLAWIRTGAARRGTGYADARDPGPMTVGLGPPRDPDWYDAFPARPSTLAAALERIPGERRGQDVPDARIKAWAALGDAVTGARDGAALVDGYVAAVDRLLAGMLGTTRHGTAARADLDAARAALRPFVVAAVTGTTDAIVPDALLALDGALACLDRNPSPSGYHADRRVLAAWVRELYLPAHAVPEADVDALAGLGASP